MSLLGAIADWVVGGGPTGLIASGISAFTKYKQTKLELEHARASWRHEYRMHALERRARAEQVAAGLELVREVGAATAFTAAVGGEARVAEAAMHNRRIPGWILGLRVALRPALTLLLFGATILTAFVPLPAIAATTTAAYGGAVTLRQAFMATVGFWFGQRIASPTDRGR